MAEIGVTGVEKRVCEMIASRQALGIAKYGTTLADNTASMRAWLVHALEETLDQALYLQRAIDEIDASPMMQCVSVQGIGVNQTVDLRALPGHERPVDVLLDFDVVKLVKAE